MVSDTLSNRDSDSEQAERTRRGQCSVAFNNQMGDSKGLGARFELFLNHLQHTTSFLLFPLLYLLKSLMYNNLTFDTT